MKPKILLIGFEWDQKILPHVKELQSLAEKFEIISINFLINALDEIAKAKLLETNPIRGFVFQRNILVANPSRCQLIVYFAEKYSEKEIIVINMIHNDQDVEARNKSVSADYCKVNDWKRVEALFDKLLT